MTFSAIGLLFGLALSVALPRFAAAASPDCTNTTSSFDNGVCNADHFGAADVMLGQTYQQLRTALPAPAQASLRADEKSWRTSRERLCTLHEAARIYVDFACATRLTQARISVLQGQLASHVMPADYSGQYTVPGTAMPWAWHSGGLNAAYRFGAHDGTAPLILTMAGLNAHPGQMLVVNYAGGQVFVGQGGPGADANGVLGLAADTAGAVPLPSSYMGATPVYQGALVGAFTDSAGRLVAPPFAIGDGPVQRIIPAAAIQLQLGINGDHLSQNTGSFSVSVSVADTVDGRGIGAHGCAIFGASADTTCQAYPAWVSGLWQPPRGVGVMHVFLVGAGDGGCAALSSSLNTPDEAAGKLVAASLHVTGAPVQIQIGQTGNAAAQSTIFGNIHASGNNGDLVTAPSGVQPISCAGAQKTGVVYASW